MNYVIGDAIRKKIVEKGMTFVSFADKFGVSDRNLQHVFKKNDLPITQIVRASEILEYDFLYDYVKSRNPKYKVHDSDIREDKGSVSNYNVIPDDFTTMTFSLKIAGTETHFDKFPELLHKTRKIAEELGFKLV